MCLQVYHQLQVRTVQLCEEQGDNKTMMFCRMILVSQEKEKRRERERERESCHQEKEKKREMVATWCIFYMRETRANHQPIKELCQIGEKCVESDV